MLWCKTRTKVSRRVVNDTVWFKRASSIHIPLLQRIFEEFPAAREEGVILQRLVSHGNSWTYDVVPRSLCTSEVFPIDLVSLEVYSIYVTYPAPPLSA